jgi:hypothetical protein
VADQRPADKPKARLLGALGCLVGITAILLLVALIGSWAERGIFAPHGVIGTVPQTAGPAQK